MKKALIVVAKQPVAGQVKTRIAATLGAECATEIYRCSLEDTLELLRNCKAATPVISFAPDTAEAREYFARLAPGFELVPQVAGDFGERLYNSFVRVAATDAEQIVLIGTDNPSLPPSHIAEAFAALDDPQTDAVLGRVSDGGYYLIGMRQPHKILFERIAWSTEVVAAQTHERALEAKLNLVDIKPWYDLDTEADLLKLIDAAQTDDQRQCRTRTFVKELALGKKLAHSKIPIFKS